MKGDGNFRWYYAQAEDAEVFHSAESLDDAVTLGRADFEGETFVVCEADKAVVTLNFDAEGVTEKILESLADNNTECWSPDDGPEGAWSDEAFAALNKAIEGTVKVWLERHPAHTWSLCEFRTFYYVPGADGALPDNVPLEQIYCEGSPA